MEYERRFQRDHPLNLSKESIFTALTMELRQSLALSFQVLLEQPVWDYPYQVVNEPFRQVICTILYPSKIILQEYYAFKNSTTYENISPRDDRFIRTQRTFGKSTNLFLYWIVLITDRHFTPCPYSMFTPNLTSLCDLGDQTRFSQPLSAGFELGRT